MASMLVHTPILLKGQEFLYEQHHDYHVMLYEFHSYRVEAFGCQFIQGYGMTEAGFIQFWFLWKDTRPR